MVEKIVVGQLKANCYLVFGQQSRQAVIIDPGDDEEYIINQIGDLGLKPILILATHGHFDHILAVNPLKIRFQIPFLLHQYDEFLIERMNKSARYWLGENLDFGPPPNADKFVKEGDLIAFGEEKLKVIETPGHSPGGVAFYGGGALFSGDTLFKQSIGRYDFTYSSKSDLEKSVKKLLVLPAETIVYPGHGEETTIGQEKDFFEQNSCLIA